MVGWPRVAAVLLLVQLGNAGCVTALGTQLLPEVVITERSEATQSVTIDSEPEGARIVRDGVLLGTTPAALDFAYHRETRERRRRYCWLEFPFGLIDAGIGGLGVYAIASQHPWPEDKKGYYVAGLILAPLYALVGSGLAATRLASACELEKHYVDVPHDHHLVLRSATWEEPLDLQVPRESDSASAVVRDLEAFDWDRTKTLDSRAAYREYLDKYPSGKWRQEAEPRLEQLSWQEASQADTATSYWQYMVDLPDGKRRDQAETAMARIFEREPDRIPGGALVDIVQSQQSKYRLRALIELAKRHAAEPVVDVLSSAKTPSMARSELLETLTQLADTGVPSEHAAVAREILCGFAQEQNVPESTDRAAKCEEREANRILLAGPPLLSQGSRIILSMSMIPGEALAARRAAVPLCKNLGRQHVHRLQRAAAKAGRCGAD